MKMIAYILPLSTNEKIDLKGSYYNELPTINHSRRQQCPTAENSADYRVTASVLVQDSPNWIPLNKRQRKIGASWRCLRTQEENKRMLVKQASEQTGKRTVMGDRAQTLITQDQIPS